MIFEDRFHAARLLAEHLEHYKSNKDVVIIAIPRGALEIGFVLAQELHAPLDVIFTKKIGAPGQPEFAIGAVSMEHMVISPEFAHIPQVQEYANVQAKEIRKVLQERIAAYRKGMSALDLKGKIVIVTDDGVATGRTLMLTIELIKEFKPKKIVVAIPVGPRKTIEKLKEQVDEVVCLEEPVTFMSVGQFYRHFGQVEDKTAIDLLKRANES